MMLNFSGFLLIDIKRLINTLSNCVARPTKKFSDPSRMKKLLSLNKRRTLFKTFAEYQFKYCLIVWMFYRRGNNKKINRIHDRVFRLVYDGDISTFGQLLDKDKSFCIHQQDIERLLIEIHNSFHDNSENSLKSLIVRRESTLNLQSKLEIMIPLVNSVLKGRNSLRIQ